MHTRPRIVVLNTVPEIMSVLSSNVFFPIWQQLVVIFFIVWFLHNVIWCTTIALIRDCFLLNICPIPISDDYPKIRWSDLYPMLFPMLFHVAYIPNPRTELTCDPPSALFLPPQRNDRSLTNLPNVGVVNHHVFTINIKLWKFVHKLLLKFSSEKRLHQH